MALRCEVIDLVGLHILHDADQISRIRQITVVQNEITLRLVGILVQMIHPVGVKTRGAALDPMDLIALLQQKLGKIGPILSSYPGDQCYFFTHPTLSHFLPTPVYKSNPRLPNIPKAVAVEIFKLLP